MPLFLVTGGYRLSWTIQRFHSSFKQYIEARFAASINLFQCMIPVRNAPIINTDLEQLLLVHIQSFLFQQRCHLSNARVKIIRSLTVIPRGLPFASNPFFGSAFLSEIAGVCRSLAALNMPGSLPSREGLNGWWCVCGFGEWGCPRVQTSYFAFALFSRHLFALLFSRIRLSLDPETRSGVLKCAQALLPPELMMILRQKNIISC